MVNKEAKKHPPSIYDIGETVLIQNPSTGIKIVKKRYVLEGKILKRNVKNSDIKLHFHRRPLENALTNGFQFVISQVQKWRKKRRNKRM